MFVFSLTPGVTCSGLQEGGVLLRAAQVPDCQVQGGNIRKQKPECLETNCPAIITEINHVTLGKYFKIMRSQFYPLFA